MKSMSGICLVTFLLNKAFITPFSNLEHIFSELSNNVYIISGSDRVVIEEKVSNASFTEAKAHHLDYHTKKKGIIGRITNHIWLQMRMSIELIKLPRDVTYVIFFMQNAVILPIIAARLLGKKTFWLLPSSQDLMIKNNKTYRTYSLLSYIQSHLQALGYHLINSLVLYSPNITQEWSLEIYKSKISISSEHVVDTETFSLNKELDLRSNNVGYIGRLSEEKGISLLMEAIPQISQSNTQIGFLIGGDGPLYYEIQNYILNSNLKNKIAMTKWIPHELLPRYLNDLKLLIIPSYTEGLPNIMLEAMACGTPVLATPVGAIPDIIKDGETGFLMENNSPECIASNVIRALEHPDLEGVAMRARALVEREFTFEKAVERWREILEEVEDGGK